MSNYIANKFISLILPILGIIYVTLLGAEMLGWSMLLIAISLIGYTHFGLGAYYQHQAWRNRVTYKKFLGWFTGMTIASILVVLLATQYQLIWLVAFLTIPYFVWHGYENEQTLFTRATNQTLCPWLLAGISITVVGLTMDAFRHSSALFTSSLTYVANPLLPSTKELFSIADPYLFITGLFLVGIGMVSVGYSCIKKPTTANIFWLLIAIVTSVWFWYANPLPYVWLFVLLLGYHFLTWSLHYAVVFWPNKPKFYRYVASHIGIVILVCVVSVPISYFIKELPLGLLNTEVFLSATIAHITTSFLNESWVRNRLSL